MCRAGDPGDGGQHDLHGHERPPRRRRHRQSARLPVPRRGGRDGCRRAVALPSLSTDWNWAVTNNSLVLEYACVLASSNLEFG